MDLLLLHTFRGWLELDLYTFLARWGQPPTRLCRFPREPMEIRRILNGETSKNLNSLLYTPHFLIMGRWWTFHMPIENKDDLLPSHIYEYGFILNDYLVNAELSRDCETCSGGEFCSYHSHGKNPTFIPPGPVADPLSMQPFDETEWYQRLEKEMNAVRKIHSL